ncbi:FAD-dependent oxidoreductase [Clostridium sp. 'deep sea']|uniref:FAD-dependent oxidoreductase n=1 Tax=Clostridium sp. 'deep sea' TaxID=2779445 RepID=UPI0018967E93|nr:FAD-dependent oxidoreductase [Clostridium sp. 'deep sea']QOR36759.1 FAD-dependent oxidoreductase [Clostridium sp. 'deep sea']
MRKIFSIILLLVVLSTNILSVNALSKYSYKYDDFLSKYRILVKTKYDVIVYGSDPEGISTAVSAARAGSKVLLIDKRDKIGGLFTLGWLNFLDMNYYKQTLLTGGIFEEFFNKVEGYAFKITTAIKVFNKMIKDETNITVLLNAKNITPIIHNNKITGIKATILNSNKHFYCDSIIDASQNGDLASDAGVPFTLGQAAIGGPEYGMAVTQVFSLKGMSSAEWNKLCKYLKNDNDIHSNSNKNTAWGFGNFSDLYKPTQNNVQLRGLNLAREPNGIIMVNALKIYAINPLDNKSLEEAKKMAKEELKLIIPFLRKNVPYMKHIELDSLAPELYIRESRHFSTVYQLTIDDILENKDFDDRIALGSYPVDMQGTTPKDALIVGNPLKYSVPLRSIVPINIDNLFIVGRTAGFDALAHGSTRVVPIGMCTGEAAGLAATFINKHKISNKQLVDNKKLVSELQNKLIANGAYLKPFNIKTEITKHPCYDGLKLVRKYGQICGNYNNDYLLDKNITNMQFMWLFDGLSKRIKWELTDIFNRIYDYEPLTFNNVLYNFSKNKELCEYLKISEMFKDIDYEKKLTKGESTMVLYYCKQFISK